MNTQMNTLLPARDLRIADEVIQQYRSWTSSALSAEAKREFTGWRLANDGEAIPYGSVFLSADQTPSQRAIELGQQAARELIWTWVCQVSSIGCPWRGRVSWSVKGGAGLAGARRAVRLICVGWVPQDRVSS
jgi:hypothetical protein